MRKVSIVMPVYNAERFLRLAVDSMLKQTYTDFELILVDDCSKDNSWNIMTEYAAQDTRVVLVRNPQNLGDGGERVTRATSRRRVNTSLCRMLTIFRCRIGWNER